MFKAKKYNAYDMLARNAPSYYTFFSHQDKKLYWDLHIKATQSIRGNKDFKEYLQGVEAKKPNNTWLDSLVDNSLCLVDEYSPLYKTLNKNESLKAFSSYRLSVLSTGILSEVFAIFLAFIGFTTSNPDVSIVVFILSPLLLTASFVWQLHTRNTLLKKLESIELKELESIKKAEEYEEAMRKAGIPNEIVHEDPYPDFDSDFDPDSTSYLSTTI